ncbi:hypothetical protein ACWCOV_07130 [Kribbella sp. NPDC002412]
MSDDFSEYVAARWAGLVRSAVLVPECGGVDHTTRLSRAVKALAEDPDLAELRGTR